MEEADGLSPKEQAESKAALLEKAIIIKNNFRARILFNEYNPDSIF